MHQLLNKVLSIVDNSSEKEHLYQVAGDLIQAIPNRLESLETILDAAGYALSKMGEDHLKFNLPISYRALVEETVEGAKAFSTPMLHQSAERVAKAYLKKRRQAAS